MKRQNERTEKMMNWLMKWGVRRWLLNVVNTALLEYKDKVTPARMAIRRTLDRVDAVLHFLRALDVKLQDDQVTDEEADAIQKDALQLAEALVG